MLGRMALTRTVVAAALLACACAPPASKGGFDSPDPAAKMTAIRKAGQAGALTATRQIVEQLDCEDPAVRILAISVLERLTGETYKYRFDDPPYLRRAAIKRWQEALGSGNG